MAVVVGVVSLTVIGCSAGDGTETEAPKQQVSTDAPVEKPTEVVTEKASEKPIEVVTEKVTEAPETEVVTEKATEAPETEKITETPETEVVTEKVTEAPETEVVTEKVTEAPETKEETETEEEEETETEEEYLTITEDTAALELKEESDGSYTLTAYAVPYVTYDNFEETESEASNNVKAKKDEEEEVTATPYFVNITLADNQRYIYGEKLFLTTTKGEYAEDDTEVIDYTYQLLSQYTPDDTLYSAMDTAWMTTENGYANVSATEEDTITVNDREYTVIKKEFDRIAVVPVTDETEVLEENITEATNTSVASHFVIYDAFTNIGTEKAPLMLEVEVNDYGTREGNISVDASTLEEALKRVLISTEAPDIAEVESAGTDSETEVDDSVQVHLTASEETEVVSSETEKVTEKKRVG